ncbi:SLC4A3 [Bugula neritina]|uniref:SLC4A3 n=1 Tax=Bugula neritina TaxID=10212 RepID=A0A7J7J3F8_BUGNE|nr:SLC4A3 [Bugula neritina]
MAKLSAYDELTAHKMPADLTPHELFVELDELVTHQHDNVKDLMEWKEKARWIKFEEDVLDASDRWGRPHVASLSFHSLIELRRLLENGAVHVDVDAHNYISLMQAVIDRLTVKQDLPPDLQEYVMEALILRHSHQDGKPRFTRSKSYSNLMGLDSMTRYTKYQHIRGPGKSAVHKNGHLDGQHTAVNISPDDLDNPLIARSSRSYAANLDKERYNMELLKKIPQDAEVASVLVGTLDKLQKPCTVLFRLSQGLMLDHVAEVPLPIRFLFVCVGPPLQNFDYLEIGRSLSTLLSNQKFREAAYKAKIHTDMLTAMNAFLDESIVLPPGDFDRKTLLPIMHMAQKKMNERKAKAAAESQATSGGDEPTPPDDSLSRTGRPFGGLIKDVRRKFPQYISDFKDGINTQVLAAFIFIYFACLSPAITFGGLLAEKTDNYMGASEMLMATGISGIMFSLLGGQPLLIAGFTGPNMVFEEGVYKVIVITPTNIS